MKFLGEVNVQCPACDSAITAKIVTGKLDVSLEKEDRGTCSIPIEIESMSGCPHAEAWSPSV